MATKESQFLDDFNENFLVCSICSEQFKNPKILPCHHSFCETCLLQLVEKTGKLDCPICRRSCELPEGGVSSLPSSFNIQQMAECFSKRKAGESKCIGCQRENGTRHCVECGGKLCENCVTAHGNLAVTRCHRTFTNDEYEKAKQENLAMIQPPTYCSNHRESKVKFYCESCDVVICTECTVVDHPMTSHRYISLSKAVEKCRESIKQLVNNLFLKEQEARESKAATGRILLAFDRHCKEVAGRIIDHAERKIKEFKSRKDKNWRNGKTVEQFTLTVEEDKRKLLKELEDIRDNRKGTLEEKIRTLQNVQRNVVRVRGLAGQLMEYGSDVQVMAAREGVVFKILELMDVNTKRSSETGNYVTFVRNNGPYDMKGLGEILTTPRASEDAKPRKKGARGKAGHVNIARNGRSSTSSHDVTSNKSRETWQQAEQPEDVDTTVALRNSHVEHSHDHEVYVHDELREGEPVIVMHALRREVVTPRRRGSKWKKPTFCRDVHEVHVIPVRACLNERMLSSSDTVRNPTTEFREKMACAIVLFCAFIYYLYCWAIDFFNK
ncbi:E3 ubiquitin-protein ligase TRIM56-like [Ptychodera flava]|uniref:E3 ubiquitin-protein ligase TRIM56-like n=1 Tax=Ptychodera flava TaxID=63121 RepID=UPI003969E91A